MDPMGYDSHKLPGWWQLRYVFLFSSRSLGFHDPIWRAYFSDGLVQPPTSYEFGTPFFLLLIHCYYRFFDRTQEYQMSIYIYRDIYIYRYIYIYVFCMIYLCDLNSSTAPFFWRWASKCPHLEGIVFFQQRGNTVSPFPNIARNFWP